jgi:hypothetical protein
MWKFFLANSTDLSIEKDITAEARGKQLNLSYNRAGACTFNLPLTAENYNNTFTNKKAVMAMKNDEWVWSGPIWTRSLDLNEEKIDISAVGWFEILMYRIFYASKTYSSATWDEGEIVFDLLDMANQDFDTYISAGTNTTSTPRNKTFETFMSVGEEIINLSDTENGFDMEVTPYTRELNLKEPDEYNDRTEIPFGYNWGPNNIANLTIEENGGEMRNRYIVTGSNGIAYSYPNTSGSSGSASQIENNLLVEVNQITEESDPIFLQAVANGEGQIKELPITNFEMSLKPFGPANPYGIFEHFNIGDKIYFTVQKQIEGLNLILEYSPRIFAATINIDEEGREIISSLQTTFDSA